MANKAKITIEGENKSALSAISEVANSVTGLNTNLGSLPATLTNALKNPTIAITAIAGSLSAMVMKTVDAADEMSKMSQKVGTSTEALSTLVYAADLSDVSMGDLETSLKKLSQAIYQATDGTGEQAKMFQQMGVDIYAATGKLLPADAVLLKLADRFASMPDGVEKTALAIQFFGKSGQDMIPFLNSGAEGIRQLQQEARAYGKEISSETGKKSEEFNDNLTRLKSAAEGFAFTLSSHLIPPLSDALTTFAEGIPEVISFANDALSPAIEMMKLFGMATFGAAKELKRFLEEMKEISDDTGFSKVLEILNGRVDVKGTDWTKPAREGLKEMKVDMNQINQLGQYYINAQGKIVSYEAEMAAKAKEKLKADEEREKQAEKDQKRLEQLNKQWKDQSATIQNDLNKQGLDPYLQKILDIELANKRLLQTYQEIAGSKDLILRKQAMEIANALQLDQLSGKPLEQGKFKVPEGLSQISNVAKPQLDTTVGAFEAFFNATNEQSIAMRQNLTDSFGHMGQAAGSFYEATGRKSKELFAVQKAFNIAQAIMNTYEGATKALAQGGIFGTIMAAGIIASGLGMVASIASTQPGSAGGGASMRPVNTNIPAARDDSGSGRSSGGQNVVINVYTNYEPDPQKFARIITPDIVQAMQDLGINSN